MIRFDEDRIEQVRQQVGLSEDEFEAATGYSIWNKNNDFISVIEQVCNQFGVEIEYFFVDNDVESNT